MSAPLGLEVDPFAVWKDARRRVFAERRWQWGLLVAVFIVGLALAVRGQPTWVAAILGVGLVPIGAEITCYYYTAWDDVRDTALSVAVVGFVVIVTACHAFRVRHIY